MSVVNSFFFSIWVFFHEHSRFTRQQGKGEGIYLTPLYHFHQLTSAHSWQPDSNREPLVSERKSLTTKLRALNSFEEVSEKYNKNSFAFYNFFSYFDQSIKGSVLHWTLSETTLNFDKIDSKC